MSNIRRAIGILQDGDEIRAAALRLEDNVVSIEKLFTEHLSAPGGEGGVDSAYEFEGERSSGVASPDEIDLDLDELGGGKDVYEASNLSSYTNIATEMNLAQGEVALNMDVSNVRYLRLPMSHKLSRRKVLQELRSAFHDTSSGGMVAFDYYPSILEDEEVVGIRHEGRMELLENLVSVNQLSYRNQIVFDRVVPNEIALVNAVRFNYEVLDEDVSAIFFVGMDHSRITLMKGTEFFMELPIINEGYQSPDILTKIYARYLLEKTQRALPKLTRIFLSGNGITNEDVEEIQKREPECVVEILLPLFITESGQYSGDWGEEELTQYIIPIMLAASVFYHKRFQIMDVNFLPPELVRKGPFYIGVSGIIIIVLSLVVVFWGITINITKRQENERLQQRIQEIESMLGQSQSLTDSIAAMEAKIVELENRIAREKVLIGSRNQWHYIINQIARTCNRQPLTWLSNLHTDRDQFRIRGRTTRPKNVIAMATMFNETGVDFGTIEKIQSEKIEEHTVWNYEILFDLPEPLFIKRLDYDNGLFLANEESPQRPKETPKPDEERTREVYQALEREVEREQARLQQGGAEKPDETEETGPAQPQKQPAPEAVNPAPEPETKQPEKPAPLEAGTAAKPEPPALYRQALDLHFSGEHQKAMEQFSRFIAEHKGPWNHNAEYFIGECLYMLGKYPEALARFETISKSNGVKQSDAMLMAGFCKMKQGDRVAAEIWWKRVIKSFPDTRNAKIAAAKLEGGE